jgi:hypothetical protein
MDERAIFLSKRKLSLLIAGAMAFMVGGWWMLIQDAESAASMPPGLRNVIAMRAVAISCMVFFGACAVVGVIKFFDRSPNLVFSAKGVLINARAGKARLVAWSALSAIREVRIHRQRILAFEVADTERFIAGLKPATAALSRLNIELIGAPIGISGGALEIGFSELEALCLEYWRKYRYHAGLRSELWG